MNDRLISRQPISEMEIRLSTRNDGIEDLLLAPGQKAFDSLRALLGNDWSHTSRIKNLYTLATYYPESKKLDTFPIITTYASKYQFEQKHSVKTITFENQESLSEMLEEGEELSLPTGFVNAPLEGLGIIYPLRFILNTFNDITDVQAIVLCSEDELSLSEDVIRLPYRLFNHVRRAINRAHNEALSFAAKDKIAYLRGELLSPLMKKGDVTGTFRAGASELKKKLRTALDSPGRRKDRFDNATAAIDVVLTNAGALATHKPVELFRLNQEIELLSLGDLINKFKSKIEQNLSEASWQSFLSVNPFVMKLAFGIPIAVFGEQVSVGGTKFDSSGGKLADFVVRSGGSGNVSIIEIKKPGTSLLQPNEYRGDVFAPSRELAGAVVQVKDQRFRLQQEINNRKISSQVYDVYAYAVNCMIIAGRNPKDDVSKKSFELFRNGLSDITIITFDELLSNLQSLHDFLSERPAEEPQMDRLLGDDTDEVKEAEDEEMFDGDLEVKDLD